MAAEIKSFDQDRRGPHEHPYGNLVSLNHQRLIASAVGEDVLRQVASDALDLLGTSSAVYEKNGEYALGLFSSGWCRFLDLRSRELCATGGNAKALCHEECWRASRMSMETGEPADLECPGGIHLYALPIKAGEEIVGSINLGYGNPPRDPEKLAEIARLYGVSLEELRGHAEAYQPRSPEIIELAKRRLATSARLIGTIVSHKRSEDRLRRLQTVTEVLAAAVDTEQVLDAIVDKVMNVTGAHTCALALLAPDGSGLVVPRVAGYAPEHAEALRSMPLDAPIPVAEAARTGKPVLRGSGVGPYGENLPPGPEGAMAAIPLLQGDRVLGALGLRFPEERDFTSAGREFLLTIGRQCAQALERARSYDAERRLLSELSRENQRLEEIFSNLPGYFAICSGPGHVLEFSNPENIRLWSGRNPVGLPLRQAFPELSENSAAMWDRVYRTGQPMRMAEMTVPIATSAGTNEDRVFDLALLPRRDAGGKITGVLAFATEVTHRVRARRELEQQRAYMDAVLDQMPVGVALADASGTIVFLNEEARRLMGGPDPMAAARKLFEAGQVQELVHRREDGTGVRLSLRAASVRDAGGRTLAEVRAFNDIGERRRTQKILREQAEAINLSHDAIIWAGENRVIITWNTGAEQMYGFTAEEAVGRVLHELLQTHGPVAPAEFDATLRRDGRWRGELLHTTRDGRELIADSRAVLIRDDEGNPAGFLEINRDVTERRRAEQALRESEEWLKFTQEAVGVGILDWDLASGVAKWSDQMFRLYGLRPRSTPMRMPDWQNLIHPEDREEVRRRVRAALAGAGSCDLECRILWPDGTVRWVGVKGTVFFNEKGQPTRMIAASLDVTERKRAEEAQRNAQKLESIGVLAGGVAHDFNNLLTSILGNASLLQDEVPAAGQERLNAVISGAEKAADLTRQLLAYAGKGRFVIKDLDLDGLVRGIAELMRVSIPKNVDLRLDLAPALPLVRADAGQIQQIIMNLVINAAEAIGEGQPGTVTVRTGEQRFAAPFDDGLLGLAPAGHYVYMEVADTGCGMDEPTRRKIFDPFFTTKFLGRGLGLAAVSGILRSHNGAIAIETATGAGTTFRVFFPAAPSAARSRPAAAQPEAAPSVLVVDDEQYVRAFLEGSLRRIGYNVLLAVNGREAITALEANPDVQLVILDLIMPGVGGADTLAEIRRRWPGLRVLITSGYDRAEAERMCAGARIDGFIQKPYTSKDINAKVQAMMEV